MQDCIGVTYTAARVNTGTIQARSQLFINFVSAKVQDFIGVAYTANPSTMELFKLEVDYSSTSFWQLSQHWNYLSKSEKLQKSHLYSNSINTGTI